MSISRLMRRAVPACVAARMSASETFRPSPTATRSTIRPTPAFRPLKRRSQALLVPAPLGIAHRAQPDAEGQPEARQKKDCGEDGEKDVHDFCLRLAQIQ